MPGHLVAMKLLSVDERRVRDGQDLVSLLACSTRADLAMAKAAVRAMEDSGAAQGRDLQSGFQTWLRRSQAG